MMRAILSTAAIAVVVLLTQITINNIALAVTITPTSPYIQGSVWSFVNHQGIGHSTPTIAEQKASGKPKTPE